jgi:hypothetical protein
MLTKTTMTPIEETNLLHSRILKATDMNGSYQSALGWLRYETVRKMRPDQFACLYKECLQTNTPFDTLVDRLILQQP